ncbi:MAG: MBL fold metallo-hydrolase [Candidatus Njordarchaeales archaeon]
MLVIIPYGGVNEIGGNKILIIDKKNSVKVFLDFGKSFTLARKYYEFPLVYPESIEELISLGAVPDIPSLFTNFYELRKRGLEFKLSTEPPPPVDAIFVSHAHLDHYGYISLLNRRIPIYMGSCAKKIIETNIKFIHAIRSPEVFYDGLKIHSFRTGDVIEVKKDFVIKPIHMDHSVPGAYGFIIETSAGSIAYTGDFRWHGPQSYLTDDFVRGAKKEDVRVLIMEGTHIHYSEPIPEEDVRRRIAEVISGANDLVIADFSRVDYDRFVTFYEVAKKTGRKLVIDPRRFALMSVISEDPGIRFRVEMNDESIVILDKGKKRLSRGEKEVLSSIPDDRKVRLEEIREHGEEFIYTVFIGGIKDIKELKPKGGSIYILSSSEPVDEERELSFERLINWLEEFGVAMYHIHSSGHANPLDLKRIVEEIDPEIVIPIHCERPKLLKRFINGNRKWTLPPDNGAPIEIK